MARYLMPATINVEAESEQEAEQFAKALCAYAERLGMGYCVLDPDAHPALDGHDQARGEHS